MNSFRSAIYSGRLRHGRVAPRTHNFDYGVTFYYLDLSELDSIFKVPFFFAKSFPRLFGFDRKNYLGGGDSLDATVRDLIFTKASVRHAGRIRMLSQISYFGYCFNPVTFFYCFNDVKQDQLDFIVAEITNTPWNERKSYVLTCKPGEATHEFRFAKDFHVSPFFPMNLNYVWRFSTPDPFNTETLNVTMEDWDQVLSTRVFFARLQLQPLPLTAMNVVKNLIGFPLMTFKTVYGIYYQSLLLWLKRTPFYVHPKKLLRDNGDIHEYK